MVVSYDFSEGELGYYFPFKKVYSKKSGFQEIVIGDSKAFGRVLFLDGTIQLAEADEFVYHESLVHVPMCTVEARKVLIMGGGDLCALREVLKHPVEKAVVVDIDGEVMGASKEYLAGINKRSWEDPRAEVLVRDALDYVKETDERFDVVVSDLTDPGEAGDYFYSKEFYDLCKRVMSERGVLVTHGSVASNPEFTAERVYAGFRGVFSHSAFYHAYVTSFNSSYGFMMGSDSVDVAKPDWGRVGERAARINGELKHYSPEVHRAMFAIPEWMGKRIKKGEYAKVKTWFSDELPPGAD